MARFKKVEAKVITSADYTVHVTGLGGRDQAGNHRAFLETWRGRGRGSVLPRLPVPLSPPVTARKAEEDVEQLNLQISSQGDTPGAQESLAEAIKVIDHTTGELLKLQRLHACTPRCCGETFVVFTLWSSAHKCRTATRSIAHGASGLGAAV